MSPSPSPLSPVLPLLLSLLAACGRPADEDPPCEALLPGDVVITELMRDPEGTDTGREYLELYNATGAPLSPEGLELYAARADGALERRHRLAGAPVLPPGSYLALGDAREGSALPPHLGYAYGEALGNLPNVEGRVGVACGGRVLDEVRYARAGRAGAARELDGALPPDSVVNDEEAHFCDARTPFAPGALGSPGRPNPPCGTQADGGTQEATCLEPSTGVRRAPRLPQEGALVLTEVMANPAAAGDAAGEWVEVYATRAVDLWGVTLGTAEGGAALQGEGCLAVQQGEHVLLARRAEPALNGALPPVRATFTQPLSNGGGTLVLRAGGQVVDALTYPPRAGGQAGVATQLAAGRLTAEDNDAPASLCDATVRLPGGDRGTPGAPNTPCEGDSPDAGGGEEGRGDAGGGDAGGGDAGSCDPGEVEPADAGAPPEEGGCLVPGSGTRRAPVRPAAGDLLLHELMANPLGSDAEREYLELYVMRDVDLNGLTLSNGSASGRTTLVAETCLAVRAGGHVLLARRAEPARNGGLPPPLATFPFALGNGAAAGEPDRVVQLWLGATLLDEVRYRSTTEGVAAQLRPTHRSVGGNDTADAFCTSAAAPPYGEGGRGTPGAANVCP